MYETWYRTFWDFAERYFIDAEHGGWRHELDETNQPASTIWHGKPDIYHAYQAALLPRLPLGATLVGPLAGGHAAVIVVAGEALIDLIAVRHRARCNGRSPAARRPTSRSRWHGSASRCACWPGSATTPTAGRSALHLIAQRRRPDLGRRRRRTGVTGHRLARRDRSRDVRIPHVRHRRLAVDARRTAAAAGRRRRSHCTPDRWRSRRRPVPRCWKHCWPPSETAKP